MKDFKILKIKSGSTIKKALSLKDELGEVIPLIDFEFFSQIRNSKGELSATAEIELSNPFLAYLNYDYESTKGFVKNGRMTDILYMDVAVRIKNTDIVIHTETLKLEVDRGITEL